MTVDIGFVDSGVNHWHSHVQGVEGGIAFHRGQGGEVVHDDDFRDEIGHGTALAGIIRERVPEARLYALKIFHGDLNAPVSLLIAALEWAIARKIKVINLSLGTRRKKYRTQLVKLCQQAYEEGLVIIAAARGPGDVVFPSVFETVIGVYWNRLCDETSLIYHPGNAVEFGAFGRPRELPGLPQRLNFSGSSFSAAYVTAKVAPLLETNPLADVFWVKEALIKVALPI